MKEDIDELQKSDIALKVGSSAENRQKTSSKLKLQSRTFQMRNEINEANESRLKKINSFIFGNTYEERYFVSKTMCGGSPCCFKFMQALRLVMIIINMVLFCIYCYIYVLMGVKEYHFWAMLFTLLSFILLFIGSGKAATFEKLQRQDSANREDHLENLHRVQWMWNKGLWFHSLALPTMITSNILFFFYNPKDSVLP